MPILINDKVIPNYKRYYSIGEVAEIAECATSAIRFWETEGAFKPIRKNKKGNRLFTRDDMRNAITTMLLRQSGADMVLCVDAFNGGYSEQLLKALRLFREGATAQA